MVRHLIVAGLLAGAAFHATVAVAQDFKPDAAKVDQGEATYNNYCQTCHGENLVNTGQTFDLRRLTPKDRERFQNSVEKGKGQMPPWKGVVPDDDIEAIWHFIMSRRN